MLELKLSKNLIDALKQERTALNSLGLHILDELPISFPVAIDNGKGDICDSRLRLNYALKHIHHEPDLKAQETFSCPGGVGCTVQTVGLIEAVNAAKEEFKVSIKEIQKQLPKIAAKFIHHILAQETNGVVKLKEIYRHLHYIAYHPAKISWGIARDGTNVVISYDEAMRRLLALGEGEAIKIQRSQLELLPKTEKLVIHRDIQPYWIVNIAQPRNKWGKTPYENIRTSLPLFYIYDPELSAPDINFSSNSFDENIQRGAVRSDKLIQETPFLPSISAYRYIK